jgi:hypothetical protein
MISNTNNGVHKLLSKGELTPAIDCRPSLSIHLSGNVFCRKGFLCDQPK